MWTPISIEFKNLLSHVDTKFVFTPGVCTVIYGENRTDNGTTNNGSGKSTILEAIAIALLGRSLREVDKGEFINEDAEECFIRMKLENKALKSSLEIERRFYRGSKSAKISVIENNNPNTQLTSVLEANKRILELLGLTAEDLLRYFIIHQDNEYTFFTAGDVEKKAVLNRITNADIILPKIEELKNKVKEYNAEENKLQTEINKLVAKKETYIEQRQELIDNDTTADEIERIRKSINKLKKEQEQRREDINQATEGVKDYEKKLSILKIEDVTEIRKELSKARERKDKLDEKVKEYKSTLRSMEEELEHIVTCPNCSHEFVKEAEINMSPDEIRALIPELKSQMNSIINSDIPKAKEKIESIRERIEKAETLQEKKDKYNRYLKRCKSDIEYAERDMENYESRIKKYQSEIQELKNRKKDDAAIKSLTEKIKKCGDEEREVEKKLSAVGSEREMAEYWIYYLGKAGFQTYLANRSISLLEGYVNSYLKKLKTDLSVDISGYKILSDGSVREKIEVFALTKGMKPKLFKSKSGGEKDRIKLAGILAVQHLINVSTGNLGLDLICLDESLGAADTAGTENIIKVLDDLGITILMITQNVSEDYNSMNKVKVIKEDGISRIA